MATTSNYMVQKNGLILSPESSRDEGNSSWTYTYANSCFSFQFLSNKGINNLYMQCARLTSWPYRRPTACLRYGAKQVFHYTRT